MLQVLSVESPCFSIQVLQLAALGVWALQVGQEAGVDGSALHQRQAARWGSPEPGVSIPSSQHPDIPASRRPSGSSAVPHGTHWMLKGCRTMAKLSHSPSTANLLAQYTELKGSPGAEPHSEH